MSHRRSQLDRLPPFAQGPSPHPPEEAPGASSAAAAAAAALPTNSWAHRPPQQPPQQKQQEQDVEGSFPLPAFLKFCPGGITFPSPQRPPPFPPQRPQQPPQQQQPPLAPLAAAAAPNDPTDALPPLSSLSSTSSSTHWYHLSPPNTSSASKYSNIANNNSNANTAATVQRELSRTLIQEARIADDRLRQYALLYHQQQQQQQGSPTPKSSPPPLVMPSLSVLCEAVFGRLTGVPPEFVREWADAMVLAYLNDDDNNNNNSLANADTATMEQVPESEWDIWNAKPKATTAIPTASTSGSPATFPSSSPSSSSLSPALPLAYRLKDRLVKANAAAQVGGTLTRTRRRPCGYVFARGDIAWNCRTCQTDATCVICDDCFRQSDHEGHEVYFHRTSPGGCCDCGDVEAWNIRGCCPNHRPESPTPENTIDDNDDDNDEEEYVDDEGDMIMDEQKNNMTGRGGSAPISCIPCTPSDGSSTASPNRRKQSPQQDTQQGRRRVRPRPTLLEADPLEAVRTARKGKELQKETVLQPPTALSPKTTAALATVIGAAVGCLVQAVDGAGIGADPIQFKSVWAQEAAQVALGYAWPEDAYGRSVVDTVQPSDYVQGRKLPKGYQLQLRLHNDDVHTFEEVIAALYEPPTPSLRRGGGTGNGNEHHPVMLNNPTNAALNAQGANDAANGPAADPVLVDSRERAQEMTHHVDADGQVTVKVYDNCVSAMQGYRRLKTRGLHCAVVSTAQVQLELRAKQLASWLTDLSSAHPVAAALCVHALVQVAPNNTLAGYHVWPQAHFIPAWVGSCRMPSGGDHDDNKTIMANSVVLEEEDEIKACRRRFEAFPPHWVSSYCTRVEAWKLHGLARSLPGFVEFTGADPAFYHSTTTSTSSNTGVAQTNSLIRRMLLERYRKSPHALWGTLPALYNNNDNDMMVNTNTTPTPAAVHVHRHVLLWRLNHMMQLQQHQQQHYYNYSSTQMVDWNWLSRQRKRLTETVYVVDTDLRKQQEEDHISKSVYPHKLPGLHLLWNIPTASSSNEAPNPMEYRHLLAMSSYRAPMSSILLLLLLDPYPTKQVRGAVHALFLSLLTDSRFKCRFAGAFGVAYRPLSTLFCAGVGTEADTPLHFSVQILTAGSLVRALGHAHATERLLLSDCDDNEEEDQYNNNNNNTLGVFCLPIAHTIARCIHTNLLGATKEVSMILTNTFNVNDEIEDDGQQSTISNDALLPALTYVAGEHPLLTLLPAVPDDGFLDSRSTRHKRLPHLIRDLEYVIETPGTALRLLLFSKFPVYQGLSPLSVRSSTGGVADDVLVFPTVFARLLRLAQGMDPQKRKISGGHVEYEQTRWLEAFGLSLNMASARDALAESPAKTDSAADDDSNSDTMLAAFREAMGNLNAALLREIKLWLYREGMLETGLPIPSGGPLDLAQAEALQRSTLHVSGSSSMSMSSTAGMVDSMDTMTTSTTSQNTNNIMGAGGGGGGVGIGSSYLGGGSSGGGGGHHYHHSVFHHHTNQNHNIVALSCATGVKMTEHQLGLIENALKAENEMRQHRLAAQGFTGTTQGGGGGGDSSRFSSSPSGTRTTNANTTGPSVGLVMGDWLRVPHSPLAGDSLSFHLPLHRALAKGVRSLCSVVMPDSVRDANPNTWWKIPVLDDDPSTTSSSNSSLSSNSSYGASSFPSHPLVPLLKSTLRSSNCRVVWMLGPDCTPQEAHRRRARARNVSVHIAVTKVLHSLADHPIRCLAAAQQIERHLWARNGSPVAGMAMNYTSTPLCRAFRDLDLLLVQLSATGWNVGLGARRVFALLLSRFNMDGYLCDPERRSTSGTMPDGSSSTVGAAAASMMMHHRPDGMAVNPNTYLWVNPPRLQDPDHAVVLAESFFSTLCVVVTELPPPPPRSSSDSSALRQSIRRELLHALASEPRSRSEAMTAAALGVTRREESEGSSSGGGGGAAMGGVTGGLFRATFAQVLDEIGQAKKTTARSRIAPGGPPSFELSADCCEEYDPTFFHLRRQEHQHAMDVVARLRKVKFPNDCLPLVCPPPKAHPRFLPCRLLLHLPALDASIRRALLFALTGGLWLPPPEPVVPQDDLKMMNQNDDDDDEDDDDIILHEGLAAPANFSMTASGDVVITSFSAGARRSTGSRLGTNRAALAAMAAPTASSFFRRHHSHEDPLQRNGKPFSKEVVAASAISFLEVLQLLTLQAHTLEECAALHRTLPDLDEESKLISSGLSINTYLSRLVWTPESLVDVWALRPSSRGGPLDSKGSGERRGSMLGLLIALYEHRSDHSGGSAGGVPAGEESDDGGAGSIMDTGHHGGARHLAAHGLKWLLRFVRALVDGATSVKAAAKSATTGVPIVPPQSSPSSSTNTTASGAVKRPAVDTTPMYLSSSPAPTARWTIDEGVRKTIQGMLDNLPDLWPQEKRTGKQSGVGAAADGTTMSASQKNKEAGKEAQRRVMELMMRKQRNFAATMEDTKDAVESATCADEECIICRCDDADGEINGPLGYLGHVQRSRASQMRSVLEAEMAASENENSTANNHNGMLMRTFRVVGHMGCQLRETEALDSKQLMCLPRGSVVTVLKRAFSADYGILSRRVLVRHVKKPNKNSKTSAVNSQQNDEPIISEGWASVMSSQGYVILSPLVSLCYANSKWGSTRPIIRQCGHAAHLKCVETHTLSLHQRAAGEQPYDGRFAANIADGEFLCPLCKQLSNILIPRDTPSSMVSTIIDKDKNKMDVDPRLASNVDVTSTVSSASSSKIREISELLHVPALTQRKEEDPNDLRVKALEDFGSHLYQAMEVSWDRTATNRKKQQKWHSAIRTWDYEEEASASGPGSMGLPRLIRQQLIAWAAIGHSASAAEAGARGLAEVLPFGTTSKTTEPWNGFSQSTFKTHAMLRELKRTLSGASGLLEALCFKMTNRLLTARGEASNEDCHQRADGQTPVILRCLGDILDGRSWVISSALANAKSARALALWTEVTALTAALPCHVARDGVLSPRCEARAAAAMMWATKGGAGGASFMGASSSHNPTLPLAVRNVLTSIKPPLRMAEPWGSMDPCVSAASSTSTAAADSEPFRLGIASGYMYTPLLAWDLNTFSGAILSALLLQDVHNLPNNKELLQILRMLLCARIVQAIAMPGGFELPEADDLDDEEDVWTTAEEVQTQGMALARLVAHCRVVIASQCLDPYTGLLGTTNMDGSAPSPLPLLCGVGRAILPFARSLILMVRATVAVIRDRQIKTAVTINEENNEADKILQAAILDKELMECEDGFAIVKGLHGPLPTELVDFTEGSPGWFPRVNRWLVSFVGFEVHQGSSGRSLLPLIAEKFEGNDVSFSLERQLSDDRSRGTSKSSASSRRHYQEVSHAGGDQVMDDAPPFGEGAREINANQGGFVVVRRTRLDFMEDFGDNDGAADMLDEVDMDDAEEMVEFADPLGFGDSLNALGVSASGNEDPNESSDENSESGSEDGLDGLDNSAKFANVSRSPIIPYQSSFLGMDQIGPGRHGAVFEYGEASAVMSDLSHLSMIHRKHTPTFNLVRLPKSFVELYNIVSKVKGREESAGTDEHDDVANSETAICLLTGTVMRSGSPRRSYTNRSIRLPGACTLHARKHGSGIGMFFLVQKCTVLLMHNNKSAYSPSIYVDEHGEEDPGLRRGRPLFLNDARYRALELLWRHQGIPREVAQIRSTSDRVIRDNWY